ncbi:unnamed protein product [Sphagnum jensenii]|uniref:Uncharacterized protein n=1 Tax=Sphagnum jensenii TaxID=128206 RepID=A0ABP0XA69_9BRYO
MSHGLAWQNQQLVLPGVDESGEGTPWQNQQPILLSASESLVRIHMVESTADSARGTTFQSHGNAAELVQNQPFQLGELAEGAPSKINSPVDGPFTGILVELSIASESSLRGSHNRPPTLF